MGCRYSISRSGGEFVLVDARRVSRVAHSHGWSRRIASGHWHAEWVGPMQIQARGAAGFVVVAEVEAEDALELAATENQEPVEHSRRDAADPRPSAQPTFAPTEAVRPQTPARGVSAVRLERARWGGTAREHEDLERADQAGAGSGSPVIAQTLGWAITTAMQARLINPDPISVAEIPIKDATGPASADPSGISTKEPRAS